MFFQKDIETMPRRELESLQLERLRHLVDYCHKNVPFYRDRLDAAGVTAEKIKTLSDIRYIPMTTKADIRDNYPYGLFAVPMKKIVRIHASSGTTGKPTVVGYTKNDINTWSDCVARLCAATGNQCSHHHNRQHQGCDLVKHCSSFSHVGYLLLYPFLAIIIVAK